AGGRGTSAPTGQCRFPMILTIGTPAGGSHVTTASARTWAEPARTGAAPNRNGSVSTIISPAPVTITAPPSARSRSGCSSGLVPRRTSTGYSRTATPTGSPAGNVISTSLLPAIQLAVAPARRASSWPRTVASSPGTGVAAGE